MPVDLFSLIAPTHDLITLALVAAGMVALVFLVTLWRVVRGWRAPVRAYEREQRAMANFRRHLARRPYAHGAQDR